MIEGTCDVELPPIRTPSPGHAIACHLPDEQLAAMEPVIVVEADKAAPAPELA